MVKVHIGYCQNCEEKQSAEPSWLCVSVHPETIEEWLNRHENHGTTKTVKEFL